MAERSRPPWSDYLTPGLSYDGDFPAAGVERELEPLRIRPGADHPAAIRLALRARGIVDAWRDPNLDDADADALLDLLRVVYRARMDLAGLEERLLVALRARPDDERPSWQDLAGFFDIDRSTMATRHRKIMDAMLRNTTAAFDAEADPEHWRQFPIKVVRDPDGRSWSLVVAGGYNVRRFPERDRSKALSLAGRYLISLFDCAVTYDHAPVNGLEAYTANLVDPATITKPTIAVYGNGNVVVINPPRDPR